MAHYSIKMDYRSQFVLRCFALLLCFHGYYATSPPYQEVNPCTPANIKAGRMYHPFRNDQNKFIQCSEFGHAYIRTCPKYHFWSTKFNTCARYDGDQIVHTVDIDEYQYEGGNQGAGNQGSSNQGNTNYMDGSSHSSNHNTQSSSSSHSSTSSRSYMGSASSQSHSTSNSGNPYMGSQGSSGTAPSMGNAGSQMPNGHYPEKQYSPMNMPASQNAEGSATHEHHRQNSQMMNTNNNMRSQMDNSHTSNNNMGTMPTNQQASYNAGSEQMSSGQVGSMYYYMMRSMMGNQANSQGGSHTQSHQGNTQTQSHQGNTQAQSHNMQTNSHQGNSQGQSHNMQTHSHQGNTQGQSHNMQARSHQGNTQAQSHNMQTQSHQGNTQTQSHNSKTQSQDSSKTHYHTHTYQQPEDTQNYHSHYHYYDGHMDGYHYHGDQHDMGGANSGGDNNNNNNQQTTSNACELLGLQFIAHPTNTQFYYECVNGMIMERQCPQGQVWMQPNKACILSGGNPQESTQENPCLISDDRFHPYPGNPRRFLECQAWYSIFVWDCGEGNIWVQELQSCAVLVNRPEPTIPPTQLTAAPTQSPTESPQPDGSVASFCIYSHIFYHPYPADRAKYIQCDEFGNMYIRKCGPNKMWDDGYKTCVGNNALNGDMAGGMDGAGGMGEAGREGDGRPDCGEGKFFHPNMRRCLDVQQTNPNPNPFGTQNDPSTSITSVTCPQNYVYNAQTGWCDYASLNGQAADYNPGPNCQDGYLWDTVMNMCVQAIAISDIHQASSLTNNIPGGVQTSNFYFFHGDDNNNDNNNDNTIDNGGLVGDIDGAGGSTGFDPIWVNLPGSPSDNPCERGEGFFYFTHPDDPRYFIQCDHKKVAHVMPCPAGLYFNQGLQTCVDYIEDPGLSNGNGGGSPDNGGTFPDNSGTFPGNGGTSPDNGGGSPDNGGSPNNGGGTPSGGDNTQPICQPGETDTFKPYPNNGKYFIMCTNGSPVVMNCPEGSEWDQGRNSCWWPQGQDGSQDPNIITSNGDEGRVNVGLGNVRIVS